ncbi:MAG: intradiol ring-cleavage dioxygenase [Blastocatellia bacterium]|nr:intradiol ring-cleavage dioxygenase [Blastocatellia bacterium]
MTKTNQSILVSRRGMLRLLGAAGATALVGFGNLDFPSLGRKESITEADSLSCIVRPSQTEGPYFVDEMLNRSDIRTDPTNNQTKEGVPLRLRFQVSRVVGAACAPLAGAFVDIWHCDAQGTYSDVSEGMFNTRGLKYLRGYQVTDETGLAEFVTIYPGWYPGRTVHIHFKIRLFAGSQRTFEFTSQLYFDDSLTDIIHGQTPYVAKGTRNTRNSNDGIFRNSGEQLMPSVTLDAQGYLAVFDIGLTGVPATAAPTITGATVQGKKLTVTGTNFGTGATLFLNGEVQPKTVNDTANPTTVLVAKKSGLRIPAGASVTLQVKNPDGTSSNLFRYP